MNRCLSDVDLAETAARDLLAGLKRMKAISKADVSALRAIEDKHGLSFDVAAEMIAIERGPADKCREWGEYLIETMLDFLVWSERPGGVVTDQQASWLLVQVGETPTPACMALLVSILEEAHTVPNWFSPAVRLRAVNALAALEPAKQYAA